MLSQRWRGCILPWLWSCILVHVHLLLASGEKIALFFEFRTIIPLENHCFVDRPFLPFEVGRARAIALISLPWLKLTTWFGGGWAIDKPIFAVLNQLANVNGLKGQLINLASTLTTNGAQVNSKVKISTYKRTPPHSFPQLQLLAAGQVIYLNENVLYRLLQTYLYS